MRDRRHLRVPAALGVFGASALIGLIAAACGGTETVVQTVVVEKQVEKPVVQTVVVEKPVEKVVQQTVVVEKPVEKVVQQTVVVVQTATPTAAGATG